MNCQHLHDGIATSRPLMSTSKAQHPPSAFAEESGATFPETISFMLWHSALAALPSSIT